MARVNSWTSLLSKECLGNFKRSLKSPTISYSSEFEVALELHLDDGYVTGPAETVLSSSNRSCAGTLAHHQRRQFV